MCIYRFLLESNRRASGKVGFSRLASPDDLLILLSVARLGRFNAVADALGTTHTTISRRIMALDEQLAGGRWPGLSKAGS
ncbi:MAG: helix-turn-helix domain-containing protein [Lacisediminihabitans sp.]